MTRVGRTRREVLRTGSAFAATGAMASSAGCLDALPFLGGVDYARWLHEPGEVAEDNEHYDIILDQPAAMLDHEEHLDDGVLERFETNELGTLTGIDPADRSLFMIWNTTMGPLVQLVKGSYDRDEVVDELEGADLEETSDHEGYTIFAAEARTVGVSEDAIVASIGSGWNADFREEAVTTAINTRQGEVDRYVQERAEMQTLVNSLGDRHSVHGWTHAEIDADGSDGHSPEAGRFEGQVGRGYSTQVEGERTERRHVFVFDDAETASDAAVDEYVDNMGEWNAGLSGADDLSTNVTGTAVVVSGTVDSDEL